MLKAEFSRRYRALSIALVAALVVSAVPAPVAACSRAVYVAKDGTVITGRSMDWGEDMHSNMWVLPRGMKQPEPSHRAEDGSGFLLGDGFGLRS